MRRVEGPSARRLVLVPGVALALLATGCAAQGERDDSGASRETTVFANGVVGADDPGGEPVAGGEISFVTFGEARSLDPAQTLANGTSGGIELAALYDVLLRFDPATGDYEPWLAESMQPDAEMRTWTMTLRDGVRFSDGSVLDAAAVRSSIERYVADGGDQASVWTRNVRRVRLEDERTVVFELAEPWEGFEYLLATGPGMIVGSASDRGDEFVPVGAGPFVLERMAPQEELVLTANPDYWRGAPALDTVRFSTIAGDPPKVDMLAQGQADMAYLRKPAAVTDARDRGLHGLMEINSVGEALLLNHRPGAGTADVRVRKAISLAIDRDLVNERVHEGLGIPEAGVFSELSQWSTEDQADGFDPDRARELLDEARADGFDGTISFLGVAPGSESVGIALKALLEDVGFDVELDYVSSPTDLVEQIYVSRDYEMAIWGFGIPDGEPYAELFESFHSESASNVGAYADPAMDRAVERLRTATADDQVQAAIDEVQEVWDETVPAIPLMANPEFVAWQPTIHGVAPSIDGLVLLGTAWEE